MEISELVTLISQNGIGIICVAFMIYFITNTLKENNSILDEIEKTLVLIQDSLNNVLSRVEKLEKNNRESEVKKDG